jgi:hypothetical protein
VEDIILAHHHRRHHLRLRPRRLHHPRLCLPLHRRGSVSQLTICGLNHQS